VGQVSAGLSRVKPGAAIRRPALIRERDWFMNKNDLIAAVADKTGTSKAQAGQSVDATFDAITDALKAGDDVKIIGFGNFNVATRAASMGRNPRTGEAIKIAASKSPKFKAGKGLKDAVNR
jgi:DNA-binding protein HU-beta